MIMALRYLPSQSRKKNQLKSILCLPNCNLLLTSESGPSSFKSVSRSDEVGNLCNVGRFYGIEVSSESEWSEPEDDLPYASMTASSPPPSPDSDDGLYHGYSISGPSSSIHALASGSSIQDIGNLLTPSMSINEICVRIGNLSNAERFSLLFHHVDPPTTFPTNFSHGSHRRFNVGWL